MATATTTTTATGTVSSILVVIAMEAEAAPLIQRLGLKAKDNTIAALPSKLYSGHHNNIEITVAVNGKCNTYGVDNVGTVPATLTTFYGVQQVRPDLILNVGTAGGYQRKGALIGDAFVGTLVKNHDRRIPIPGYTEYGIGGYTSISCPNLIQSLSLKQGVVSTSNSLDHSEEDDKHLLANDTSVKDMEAAAVAWAAQLSSTPFLPIKVVTDIVDGERPTHEEFLENLHKAADSLQLIVPKVIDFIAGKKLTEL